MVLQNIHQKVSKRIIGLSTKGIESDFDNSGEGGGGKMTQNLLDHLQNLFELYYTKQKNFRTAC